MSRHSKSMLAYAAILLCLIGAGCAPQASKEPAERTHIKVSGSGTTLPLVRLLASAYPDRSVEFEYLPGLHSAAGIEGVASGAIDIGLVSRELTDEERALGLTYTVLSNDGLVIAVHPSVGVRELTTEQVRDIYRGRYSNWKELGGADLPIVVLDRNEDESAKIVLRKYVLGSSLEVTASAAVLSHEPDMISALSSTPGSIGYFSLGAAVHQRVPVDVVALDGVRPSIETLLSGEYRVVRPLGIVTRPDAGPAVKKFVQWAAGPEAQVAMEREGYAAAR